MRFWGELNSPVEEDLFKGSMSVWSPTPCRMLRSPFLSASTANLSAFCGRISSSTATSSTSPTMFCSTLSHALLTASWPFFPSSYGRQRNSVRQCETTDKRCSAPRSPTRFSPPAGSSSCSAAADRGTVCDSTRRGVALAAPCSSSSRGRPPASCDRFAVIGGADDTREGVDDIGGVDVIESGKGALHTPETLPLCSPCVQFLTFSQGSPTFGPADGTMVADIGGIAVTGRGCCLGSVVGFTARACMTGAVKAGVMNVSHLQGPRAVKCDDSVTPAGPSGSQVALGESSVMNVSHQKGPRGVECDERVTPAGPSGSRVS
eukprot:1188708-Prorocentrum_minimum.AAC.2